MSFRRQFTVYLSSTFNDLALERAAAIEVMRPYAAVLDSCRASDEGVAATCVSDVRKCNLYIGIVAKRYGFCPSMGEQPGDVSITEIEYDSCRAPGQPRIGRLMFLKTRFEEEYSDNPSDRVDAFRKRASAEQQAFPFKEFADLKLALQHAVRFHAETALPGGAMGGPPPRADLLFPVALATLTGTDDAVAARLADPRFHTFDISPADPQWLARFDASARRAQTACLLVTTAGLSRLVQPAAAARVAAAAQIGAAAGRPLTLVLAGVDAAALPADWADAECFGLGADALATTSAASAALDAVYQHLRADQPGLTMLPRLALPYVIIAPTRAEVDSLLAADKHGFDGYADEDDRADRIADLVRLAEAARAAGKEWPESHYAGANREAWHCFGAAQPSIEVLLRIAIERINNAADATRERRLLGDARIVPRAYRLEELLDDRHGSASALLAAIERGGLVLIDELALLHPVLREAAQPLLRAGRTAVVSVSACDPAHSPTRRLIGSRSFMHVGALVTRYVDDQDPRCEVSINSVERLQRWLRLAIPDLTSQGDGSEVRVDLIDKIDGVFMQKKIAAHAR